MPQEKQGNYDIKRGNYFQGMMLVDQDFKDEQTYHSRMRHNHNLELHTWGVVRGLDVTPGTGAKVNIAEGLAIDASGKEIWSRGGQLDLGAATSGYIVVESVEELSSTDKYPQMEGKYLRLIDTARFSLKEGNVDNYVVLAALVQGRLDTTVRRSAASVRAKENDIEIRPVTKFGALRLMAGEPLKESLTVAATGRVGVGVPNPQAALDVSGVVSIRSGRLQFSDGDGNVYPENWIGMANNVEGTTKWLHIGGITDAGARRVFIGADRAFIWGNLGIGTSAPGDRLQIGESIRKFGVGEVFNATLGWGTSYAGFNAVRRLDGQSYKWQFDGDSVHNGGAVIYGDIFGNLRFVNVSSTSGGGQDLTDAQLYQKTKMTLSDVGNLSLAHAEGGELELRGWPSGWMLNAKGDGKSLYLNRDASATSNVLIGRNGNELFVRGSDGKVGIGTKNPKHPLQVGDDETAGTWKLAIAGRGNVAGQSGASAMRYRIWTLRTGDGTTEADINNLRIRDENANNNSGADRVVIDQNGKVGIGVAPDADVHIRRDAAGALGPTLLIQNGGGTANAEARIDIKTYSTPNTYPNFSLRVIDDGLFGGHVDFATMPSPSDGKVALVSRLYIKSNGNVGVGTQNPKHPFQVGDDGTVGTWRLAIAGRGNVAGQPAASAARYRIWTLRTGDGTTADEIHKLKIRDENAGAERLVIDESGNVEIGGNLKVGNISSPKWKVTNVINQTGPLNISRTFTAGGGTLIVFASGSAYKANRETGTIGMDIFIDNVKQDSAKSYTNEGESHKSFVSVPLVLTGISAGSHTVELRPINDRVFMDANDYFRVTILELPF